MQARATARKGDDLCRYVWNPTPTTMLDFYAWGSVPQASRSPQPRHSTLGKARESGSGTKQMKAKVTIEYDLLPADRIVVRDREEQRWITCETLLVLPGSATVKVELLEVPLMPDHVAPGLASHPPRASALSIAPTKGRGGTINFIPR